MPGGKGLVAEAYLNTPQHVGPAANDVGGTSMTDRG
jgi:hypothetical protein